MTGISKLEGPAAGELRNARTMKFLKYVVEYSTRNMGTSNALSRLPVKMSSLIQAIPIHAGL